MHEKLKAYVAKKEEQAAHQREIEKRELLSKLDLYDKEYSDTTQYSVGFPFSEFDASGHVKYYRKVPIEISDEEYAKLLEYEGVTVSAKNTIAEILRILAWGVWIIGLILGFVFGRDPDYWREYHLSALALAYWASSFLFGMLLMGFAEVIQLLTDMKNKVSKKLD